MSGLFNPDHARTMAGNGWETTSAETATLLSLTDHLLKLAEGCRHAGPKTLSIELDKISRLQPRLKDSYERFRAVAADDATERFADHDGEVAPLIACDDAVALIAFLSSNLQTREGVQQILDQLELLRDQVRVMDRR